MMINKENMTLMEQRMFDQATEEGLTLFQAVEQLRANAELKTTADVLSACTGISIERGTQHLQTYLVDSLMRDHPEWNRDSVARKVRTWMKVGNFTLSKASVVRLAFAWKLSLEETNSLLCRLCGEGFHGRDPEDMILIYAFTNGLSESETRALHERADELGLLKPLSLPEPIVPTAKIRGELVGIKDANELIAYLGNARHQLGKLHNTAYTVFRNLLSLLAISDRNERFPKNRKYPIRDILVTYLYANLIPRRPKRSAGGLTASLRTVSALQRSIRRNWPDQTVLCRMIQRETDVTRKVLILLFLATDGGETKYGNRSQEELSFEGRFSDMYQRLNRMLSDCGFSELDARIHFDWMVLYCMCADETIYIDGKLQRFLSAIFRTPVSEEELFACDESCV